MRWNIKQDGDKDIWFAWYPVIADFNKWVWLEKVDRIRYEGFSGKYYRYYTINK